MTAGGQQPGFHALRTLLGHRRGGQSRNIDARDYNWQSPHGFRIEQCRQAAEVAQRLCEAVGESMGRLLGVEMRLESKAFDQHYSVNLKAGKPPMAGYSLMLAAEDGREVGYIILSPARALGWVSKRLGSFAGDVTAVRRLSTLETNLLLDIFTTIRDSMAAAAPGLAAVKCSQEIIEGMPRLAGPGYEEFCRFTFAVPKEEGEPAVRVVLQSNLVESAFDIAGQKDGRTPADVRKCIMAHLGRVPIELQAVVGQALVSMEDIIQLVPGDIVPLDTRITDSIRLALRSHCIMRGWMSVSKDNYAVQVSGPPGEDDE
ncbi:MAG: FliM/FliN family flagellar motor switch protein [Planctomycetes bacterium]|nr:FliM/FliN family flagellar motor switch protein [Planctomycetota bacterium]